MNEKLTIYDTMIISDEIPPQPVNGRTFTLWTESHENNTLIDESGTKCMFL
jgi:hypothetical protein